MFEHYQLTQIMRSKIIYDRFQYFFFELIREQLLHVLLPKNVILHDMFFHYPTTFCASRHMIRLSGLSLFNPFNL